MVNTIRHFLRRFSQIFIIFAVCMVVINIFLGVMFKDNAKNVSRVDPVLENRKQIYETINDPKYQKNKYDKTMIAVYRLGICGVLGEACTNNPSDGDKNFNRSFFGLMASGITFPYVTPPASGIDWAYSGLQQAGFVPKSYATDGIGFSALRPLTGIWIMFRNIAFALIVLFIVIIGFMIMFRFKINPQTVVSLSNALPRLVITLILISFSFAIGGFLIDLMYIVTIIGVRIVGQTLLPPDTQKMFIDSITTGGTGRLFDLVFWNGETFKLGGALFSLMPPIINQIIRLVGAGVSLWLIKKFDPIGKYLLGGEAGDVATFGGVAGPIVATASWIIIPGLIFLFLPLLFSLLILITTGLLVFFRILFMLFAAYLRIVIAIIFSPIILLTEVIPGRNSFSKWFRTLVADLILFPLTLILITLSSAILGMNNNFLNIWQPPFLYTPLNQSAFNVIVAIGMMYMIPDIGKHVREFMGIKGSPLKFGFSTFIAGGAALGTGAMGSLGKYSQLNYAISPFVGRLPGGDKGIMGMIKKAFPGGGGHPPTGGGGHEG